MNIRRKIERMTAQFSELDLRIPKSGNLASMKKPSGKRRDCRSSILLRENGLRGEADWLIESNGDALATTSDSGVKTGKERHSADGRKS